MWALPSRVRRHERERQWRPLPLLRLLGTPEARTKGCDGDCISREKLEDAVIEQLAGIYRDGHLIRQAIEQAAEGEQGERAALEDRRASVTAEIKRAERAIDRYLDAFENGDLDAKRFQSRMDALQAKLDGLRDSRPAARAPARRRSATRA